MRCLLRSRWRSKELSLRGEELLTYLPVKGIVAGVVGGEDRQE
jgi:hypothetical protein